MLHERARAKINLTLHILGRRADGYHELESFVAFAGVCDHVFLRPGALLDLTVEGPTAASAGPTADNLVFKAARNLAERAPDIVMGSFRLVKNLPAAAGVGGGSSDAAAALRLLARLNHLPLCDERVKAAARATGADVPVCLTQQARMMRGVGEVLSEPVKIPPLYAVLVNPRVAVETRPVFQKLNLGVGQKYGLGVHPHFNEELDAAKLIGLAKKGRNDLEDPAGVLAPAVVDVLAVLGAARGVKLARMSGSGATCYALFENRFRAVLAAKAIQRDHPQWWTRATLLR